MRWRSAAVVAVACLACLVPALPASAEARGRIVGISPTPGKIQVSFSADGLLPDQRIDLDGAEMSLNGQPLEVTAAPPAAVRVVRRVLLTIDTSGSMGGGGGIESARTAAKAFLAEVPADVEVGLVAFASEARLVVPLTRDRSRVAAAVDGLQAGGRTTMFDAVALAARSFPATGDRQILLLSDGVNDDVSRTTLPQLTSLLARGDIALDAVAFRSTDAATTLGQLTQAAGGRVVSATGTAELSEAFTRVAEDDGKRIVLSAELPEGFTATEGTVVVSATAAGQRLTDSALAVGLVEPAEPVVEQVGPQAAELAPAFLRSNTNLYLALAAVFAGLLALTATAVAAVGGRVSGGSGRMSKRLAAYTVTGRQTQDRALSVDDGRNVFTRSLLGAADRLVQGGDLETRLGARLEAGGVPLKPAEWLLLHVGLVLCVPLFVLMITGGNPVLTVLALVLSALGPWGYLVFKKARRTKAFLAQLPDVLQLLSGSLSAGYSLPQAMDAVVRQGNEPVATEFNKALVEARIGAPIQDALEDVAERMDSVDFRWVVMAIRIQRDVGGNLAELLSTVAATLRERERLRRQVATLSAEGRLSAWILGGLPIAFALYLGVAQPTYLMPLITDPIGWLLIGAMVVLMLVGGAWMKKVVTVEV